MPSESVSFWAVPLAGHQFDLEDLPLWLANEPISVAKRDDTFELRIPADVVGTDYKAVRPFAEEHIQFINGIGRLLSPGFRPVTLTDRLFGLDADERVIHTVLAVQPAEARMKGGVMRAWIGDRLFPDPREAAAALFLRAAARSARARAALILLGRAELSWAELYLLFELVEASEGDSIYSRGWVSKRQTSLFTQTANSYSVLGLEGRHAKDRGSPPASPMARSDAESMVRSLAGHWFEFLAAQVQPPTSA
jgi:hypothetical protein